MVNQKQIESGLSAYESYINSGVVIDRRELVRVVFEAMQREGDLNAENADRWRVWIRG